MKKPWFAAPAGSSPAIWSNASKKTLLGRGVDIKSRVFGRPADDSASSTCATEPNCHFAVSLPHSEKFDEVYQLAADMGGMGFISSAECEIMRTARSSTST